MIISKLNLTPYLNNRANPGKCTVNRYFCCCSAYNNYYIHYFTKTAYSALAGNFYCQYCYNTAYKNYYNQSCNNTHYYAGAAFGIMVSLPARLTFIVLMGIIVTILTIHFSRGTSMNCHYSVMVTV